MSAGYASLKAEVLRRRPLLVYYQARIDGVERDGQMRVLPVEKFLYSLLEADKPATDLKNANNVPDLRFVYPKGIKVIADLEALFRVLLAAGGPEMEERVRFNGLKKQFTERNLERLAARWTGNAAVPVLARKAFVEYSETSTLDSTVKNAIDELPKLTETASLEEATGKLGEWTKDPKQIRELLLDSFERLFLTIKSQIETSVRFKDKLRENSTFTVPLPAGGSSSSSRSVSKTDPQPSKVPEPKERTTGSETPVAKPSPEEILRHTALTDGIKSIRPVLLYERAKESAEKGEAAYAIIKIVTIQDYTAEKALEMFTGQRNLIEKIDPKFFQDYNYFGKSVMWRLNNLYTALLRKNSSRFDRLRELLTPILNDLPEIGQITKWIRDNFVKDGPKTSKDAVDSVIRQSGLDMTRGTKAFLDWWVGFSGIAMDVWDDEMAGFDDIETGLTERLTKIYSQWFAGLSRSEQEKAERKLANGEPIKGHSVVVDPETKAPEKKPDKVPESSAPKRAPKKAAAKPSTLETSKHSLLITRIKSTQPVLLYEKAKESKARGEAAYVITGTVAMPRYTAEKALAMLSNKPEARARAQTIEEDIFADYNTRLPAMVRLNKLYDKILQPSPARFDRLKELLPPVLADLPEIGQITKWIRSNFSKNLPKDVNEAVRRVIAHSEITLVFRADEPSVEAFMNWWTEFAGIAMTTRPSQLDNNSIAYELVMRLVEIYSQWFSGLLQSERARDSIELAQGKTLKGHAVALGPEVTQSSQRQKSSRVAPAGKVAPPGVRPGAQQGSYDLPESGGAWKAYSELKKEKEFSVNASVDAFPTLAYLREMVTTIKDECRGPIWLGVYGDNPAPESKGPKKMQLERVTVVEQRGFPGNAGQVRYVKKPASWPETAFVKSVELPDDQTDIDEALHEIEIGTRLALLQEANMLYGFARLYDWYLCKSGSESRLFTVQEVAGAKSLARSFITAERSAVVNRMASLLLELESAQHLIEYVHYDLHTDNAMAHPVPGNRILAYQRPNGSTMYLRCDGLESRLIDYGRNRMRTAFVYNSNPSEIVSLIGLETIGINSSFQPFYDMRLYSMTLALLKGDDGEPLILGLRMAPLLPMLNEASGHRFVPPRDDSQWYKAYRRVTLTGIRNNTTDPRLVKWRDSNAKAWIQRVDEAVDGFRKDGLAALARMHREDMLRLKTKDKSSNLWDSKPAEELTVIYGPSALAVMSFWAWTDMGFPGKTPTALLESPIFKDLNVPPAVDELPNVHKATDYRSMAKFLEVGRRMAQKQELN
jgi:hypothetical protein